MSQAYIFYLPAKGARVTSESVRVAIEESDFSLFTKVNPETVIKDLDVLLPYYGWEQENGEDTWRKDTNWILINYLDYYISLESSYLDLEDLETITSVFRGKGFCMKSQTDAFTDPDISELL